MNGTIATSPLTDPHWVDAVGSIGTGPKLTTGSGDEGNTFGNATLITPTVAIAALHSFQEAPYVAGFQELQAITDPNSRVMRFRRKADGTDPCGGLVVDYWQTRVTSYRIPSPIQDVVILYLEDAVPSAVATPISAAYAYDPLENSDSVIITGWGLDGTTLGAGALPNDVRIISDRTISFLGTTGFILGGSGLSVNLYDSGGGVFVDVAGTKYLIGVVSGPISIVTLAQFEHDADFQIPGLYTPGPDPIVPPSTWLYPILDSMAYDNDPTSDLSTSPNMLVNKVTGKGAEYSNAIITFDVSGINATDAVLHLFANGGPGIDQTIRFRRLRRIVTSLVNYNTYDGVNAWGTAGGINTTSDVYTKNEFTEVFLAVTQVFETTSANLLAMIVDAQAEDGILRLHLESVTEEVTNYIWTSEAVVSSLHPRLVVTLPNQIIGLNNLIKIALIPNIR